ncbi:hypothetical protein PGB90_010039 [Kerria lacca]
MTLNRVCLDGNPFINYILISKVNFPHEIQMYIKFVNFYSKCEITSNLNTKEKLCNI